MFKYIEAHPFLDFDEDLVRKLDVIVPLEELLADQSVHSQIVEGLLPLLLDVHLNFIEHLLLVVLKGQVNS